MLKSFDVEVYHATTGNPLRWPGGTVVQPLRWGWQATGGPREAEIEITGAPGALYTLVSWPGSRVIIRNAYGTAVWWGYVEDVEIDLGGVALGVSLEPMYNRVAVAYTYVDEEGAQQRGTTDWIEDAASVARYGRKELLYSRSDLDNEAAADALATTLLARFANPAAVMRPGGGSGRALVRCRGWWETVRWRYYKQLEGREAWEQSGSQDQVVGVKAVASTIVFQAAWKRVAGVGGQHGFRAGDRVVVSGTTNNNGVYEIVRATPTDLVSYTASTISYSATDDIYDSASGFDDLRDEDVIQVSGASNAANNGVKTIAKVQELDSVPSGSPVEAGTNFNHMETEEGGQVAEAAGSSITIARRGFFTVKEAVSNEGWGSSYTLTAWGQAVAQKFSLENDTGASWPLREVKIRAKVSGSPADNLYVSLYSDSSGSPGSGIETVSVAASSMTSNYQWVSFAFSGANSLSYGTNYWLVVGRSGSSAADDFYELSFDDSNEYARGAVKLHDGTGWQVRPVAGTIAFQVLGKQDTGAQVQRILSETADNIDAVDSYTSGVLQYQYREGDDLAADEIERLLDLGNSSNVRMVVWVTAERRAIISAQPALGNEVYRLDGQGEMSDRWGRALEPGVPLAGKWVEVDVPGLPDALANAFVFYVEGAEYSVQEGRWTLTPQNAPDPWALAALQQG